MLGERGGGGGRVLFTQFFSKTKASTGREKGGDQY